METLTVPMETISGLIWACELITTAHMAYQTSIVVNRFYTSSKNKIYTVVDCIKVYGGNKAEEDWVIIDPNKPEGWEGSEEAFPLNIDTATKKGSDVVDVIISST